MLGRAAIIVLALCFVAPHSQAAAGDEFKVYGKLHMSLESLNDGDNTWAAVSNNGSRFGIKGTREMNPDLGLVWQFEQKINIAQKGAETLATRNSFLGLRGEWGTVLYGIHDTPYKTMGSKITFFRDEIGDYRQVTLGWDRRLQDIIMYVSPDIRGMSSRLMYQVDQTGGQAEEAKTLFSGSLDYRGKGLYAGIAYEALSDGFASDTWIDDSSGSDVVRTAYGKGANGIRCGLKYTVGALGVTALYQVLNDYNQSKFAVNDNDPGVVVANDLQARTFGGEARYLFDPRMAVKVAYYAADPDTDIDDDGYELFAFGVDHLYAKDLWFYLQYAVMLNGDATSATLGCKCDGHGKIVTPAAAGDSPAGVSLGIAKKF